jgi:hypothetical protein
MLIPNPGNNTFMGTEEQSQTERAEISSWLPLSDSVPLYDYSFSGSGIILLAPSPKLLGEVGDADGWRLGDRH